MLPDPGSFFEAMRQGSAPFPRGRARGRFRAIRIWMMLTPWAAAAVASISFGSLVLHFVETVWRPVAVRPFDHSATAVGYFLLSLALLMARPTRTDRRVVILAFVVAAFSFCRLLFAFSGGGEAFQKGMGLDDILQILGWAERDPHINLTASAMLLLVAGSLLLKHFRRPAIAQFIVILASVFPLHATAMYLQGVSLDDHPLASIFSGVLCIIAFLGRMANHLPLRNFLVANTTGYFLRWETILLVPASLFFLSWSPAFGDTPGGINSQAAKAAVFTLVIILSINFMSYQLNRLDLARRAGSAPIDSHGLYGAWLRGEMSLAYQPQVDLASKQFKGVEVLLRWDHPEKGRISPEDFIPLAERSGIIGPLGLWVLREACQRAQSWEQTALADISIAVNVSAVQLDDPGFVDAVAAILRETGLPVERLILEVTESAIMRKGDQALKMLQKLQAIGICIAIDDFGTGYSSLSYLQILPSDYLKIDKSFIRALPQDARSAAIARSIIALGHSLGLRTLAEGVETEEQERFLQANRCDKGQGYLYAAPLPETALLTWISERCSTAEACKGNDARMLDHVGVG